MSSDSKIIKNSVLVVAHPDDEVLWFASILKQMERIIIAYKDYDQVPQIGQNRARAISQLPYSTTWIEMSEAGTFDYENWSHPEISDLGLDLKDSGLSENILACYEANFTSTQQKIRPFINPNSKVFTHNPWGEYGHPDHVQIFRIMEALQKELGFTLKVSPYISKKSSFLAKKYSAKSIHPMASSQINTNEATRIASIYKENACWTWANDWQWNPEENMLAQPTLISKEDPHSITRSTKGLIRIPSDVSARANNP